MSPYLKTLISLRTTYEALDCHHMVAVLSQLIRQELGWCSMTISIVTNKETACEVLKPFVNNKEHHGKLWVAE